MDPLETDLDDYKEFDIVISNDGTKEELDAKIRSILELFLLDTNIKHII
jgi:hypothetical protein